MATIYVGLCVGGGGGGGGGGIPLGCIIDSVCVGVVGGGRELQSRSSLFTCLAMHARPITTSEVISCMSCRGIRGEQLQLQ